MENVVLANAGLNEIEKIIRENVIKKIDENLLYFANFSIDEIPWCSMVRKAGIFSYLIKVLSLNHKSFRYYLVDLS